jgi:PBSX family phage terminase large subunit
LAIIGKTAQTIHRNLFLPLQDPALFGDAARHIHYTPGAPTAQILGRMVHVIGANDAKSEPKIRGMTLAGCYVDEVTLVPQVFFEQLLGRMSVRGAQLFCTTNPDNPAHWFMRDWLSQEGKKPLRRFSFTIDDNPFLDEDYVRDIKAMHEGLFYRRFILGEWVAAEGAIYDAWDRERHIVTSLPEQGIYRWISLGVDYGTSNPFHAVLLGLGRDRKLYAAAEWRYESRQTRKQLTDTEYSERLRGWLDEVPGIGAVRPQFVTVDPSAASFSAQLRRDKLTPTPAKNDVMDGIRTVSSVLASNKLLVHESCKALIQEIGGYSWDDKAALRGEEKPIKVADHGCLVTGTPVTTDNGQVPIEEVRPGDMVLTRRGYRPVVAAGMTSPAAEVFRVDIEGGYSITGTGNHPVWVEGKGWTRLDELRYADIILTCRNESKASSSEASHSVDIQTQRTGLSAPITHPGALIGAAGYAGSTKRSGWPTTGARYPRATTSITGTATPSTTTPATWSASATRTTRTTTPTSVAVSALQRPGTTWTGSGLWLPPGMDLPKGSPGTPRMGEGLGKVWSLSRGHASSAGARSIRGLVRGMGGSAGMPARPLGAAPVALTMNRGTVSDAVPASLSTSTAGPVFAGSRVLGVTPLRGAVPVWNLTVADCPEYFAGGVLVHNCDAMRYAIYTTRALWQRHLNLAA